MQRGLLSFSRLCRPRAVQPGITRGLWNATRFIPTTTTRTSTAPSIATRSAIRMASSSSDQPAPIRFSEGEDTEQVTAGVNALRQQGWQLNADGMGLIKTYYFKSYFKAVVCCLSLFLDCDGSSRNDNNGAELIGRVEFRERGRSGECGQEAPSGDYRGMSLFFFFCFLYSTRKYNLLSIILVFVANWLGGRAVDDTPTAGAVAAGREDGAPLRRRRRVDGRSGRWAGPEVWLMRI